MQWNGCYWLKNQEINIKAHVEGEIRVRCKQRYNNEIRYSYKLNETATLRQGTKLKQS
jgi:hypothetical protein